MTAAALPRTEVGVGRVWRGSSSSRGDISPGSVLMRRLSRAQDPRSHPRRRLGRRLKSPGAIAERWARAATFRRGQLARGGSAPSLKLEPHWNDM